VPGRGWGRCPLLLLRWERRWGALLLHRAGRWGAAHCCYAKDRDAVRDGNEGATHCCCTADESAATDRTTASAIHVAAATAKLTVVDAEYADRTTAGMHHPRSVSAPQGDKGRVELGPSDSTHTSVGLCSLYSVTDRLNSIHGKRAKAHISRWYSGFRRSTHSEW
jgi:hypothetical protein